MNKTFSTSPSTTMPSCYAVHNRPLTLYPLHPTHRRGYPLSFEPLANQQSDDWKNGCTHYQDNISYGFLCYRYKTPTTTTTTATTTTNHNNANANNHKNNKNKNNKTKNKNKNKNKKQIEFLLCQSQSTKNWGLIKGTFESNEHELGYATAEREFFEETGMTMDKSNILYIDYTTFYEMYHVKNKNKVDHQFKMQQKLKYQQQQSSMEPSKSLASLSSSSLSSLLSSSEQINQHVQNNTKGPIHAWIKRKYNIIFICHLRENTPNTLNPPVVQTGELLCTKWVTYEHLKQHLFTRTFLPYRQCIEQLMQVHQIPFEIDAHVTDWMYLQQRFGQILDLTAFEPHSRTRHKRRRIKNDHNRTKQPQPSSSQKQPQSQSQKQPQSQKQSSSSLQKQPPKKEKKSGKEKSAENREKR